MKKSKLTDRDTVLIDDIRKAYITIKVKLPQGGIFDGSEPVAQVAFEKAVAKVVLQRTGAKS